MRIEGKYGIGTIREMAEYMLSDCYKTDENGRQTVDIWNNLKECNISVDFEYNPELTLSELYKGGYCNTWYGIKKIETGFDSPVTDLISDYYGGFCASYGFLDDEDPKERSIDTIVRMLTGTLNCVDTVCEEDVLFWEFK